MADTFKQVIPTANRKKTEKSFEFNHLTTSDFMTPQPIAIREVVPNQEIKLGLESFVRLNPLVKPTFGRAKVNNRAFFVPMRVLMPRWNEFLASEPIYSMVDGSFGLQTVVPQVRNDDLIGVLDTLSSTGTSTNYDFSYLDTSNVIQYRLMGPGAHFAYKLFLGLGYRINWNYNDQESYSALPLLAFSKIMIDWYYPSQYINSSDISAVTPYLQSDSLNARVIPQTVLGNIITICCYCAYDDSLLVNAWDNPVGPNNGVESAYSIPDITLPNDARSGASGYASYLSASVHNVDSNGTPIPEASISANASRATSITQYQHDVLKALTDYTTRHRLSGVRAVDRLLSEYGINLSSEIMKRSILLGSDSYNIQFGDVMSHTDNYDSQNNSGANLGDYAGKGIGYGNHTFTYNLGNEFGYLIVVNSVIPQVDYYQGINRFNKHLSILDFWHADFDGLGVQAVAADEVCLPESYDSGLSLSTQHSKVFGFVPRYAEYKTAPSVMSGLFALNGNTDIKAFSFMRDLTNIFSGVSSISHSLQFVQGDDSTQYNRIFYNNQKGFSNNFIFIHHFTVNQTDETSPLYDTYDFNEVERAVEVHTQAAKVN